MNLLELHWLVARAEDSEDNAEDGLRPTRKGFESRTLSGCFARLQARIRLTRTKPLHLRVRTCPLSSPSENVTGRNAPCGGRARCLRWAALLGRGPGAQLLPSKITDRRRDQTLPLLSRPGGLRMPTLEPAGLLRVKEAAEGCRVRESRCAACR